MPLKTVMSENTESPGGNMSPIQILNEEVNKLYNFRDHYYEKHSIEDAIHKNSDVEKELKNVLNQFEQHKETAIEENRALYHYLKGKALNITPKYDKSAEDLLSKAVKLDPKLVSAWNELGECYWKNDNIQQAKSCFTNALQHVKNQVSLRNLSMVARQESTNSKEEKVKNIEQGLTYAREAVNLDPKDGISWSVLGNAHLSSFFTVSQNPKTLKSCMSAYLQAEKDIIANSNPDLHYNKAIALKYEEEFKLALESFNKALQLDPTWDSPKTQEKQMLKYLDNLQKLVHSNGKMKGKRLQQILNSIDDHQLGPYFGGKYSSPNGQSISLKYVPILSLKPGINEETVVLGKVVCSVHNDDSVPFTFCMIDKNGTCIAVTVYNLAEGKGVIIGDSVAIPEPYFSQVNFSYKDKKFSFQCIRVETPLVMVVNAKKVGRDQQAGTQLKTFKKAE